MSFARFVRENPEQIEAIRILLERPRDWKTEALNELRQKLSLNRFDEKDLQKAHKLVYNKALADIISMVKHAARQEEPILTAEERVDRAMEKVTAGKDVYRRAAKVAGPDPRAPDPEPDHRNRRLRQCPPIHRQGRPRPGQKGLYRRPRNAY